MGIFSILTLPFKPVKWIYRKIKPKEEKGIEAVVETENPTLFQYYYEDMGFKTKVLTHPAYRGRMVVVFDPKWKEQEMEKFMQKLRETI